MTQVCHSNNHWRQIELRHSTSHRYLTPATGQTPACWAIWKLPKYPYLVPAYLPSVHTPPGDPEINPSHCDISRSRPPLAGPLLFSHPLEDAIMTMTTVLGERREGEDNQPSRKQHDAHVWPDSLHRSCCFEDTVSIPLMPNSFFPSIPCS